MEKIKLSVISIILIITCSSCETEMCKNCELDYEVLPNSSISISELDELSVESGWSDYDEYFAVTHESPGQYCDSSLTNIENEENYEDLDEDGTTDILTFWICQ